MFNAECELHSNMNICIYGHRNICSSLSLWDQSCHLARQKCSTLNVHVRWSCGNSSLDLWDQSCHLARQKCSTLNVSCIAIWTYVYMATETYVHRWAYETKVVTSLGKNVQRWMYMCDGHVETHRWTYETKVVTSLGKNVQRWMWAA